MEELELEKMTEEITALLEEKNISKLKQVLTPINPADIAVIFQDIDEEKLPFLYRILPKELAAEVFVEMDGDQQELLIRAFSDRELHDMLDELYMDDTVDLIEEMPANVVTRILKNCDAKTRQTINEILKYPKDSAGALKFDDQTVFANAAVTQRTAAVVGCTVAVNYSITG